MAKLNFRPAKRVNSHASTGVSVRPQTAATLYSIENATVELIDEIEEAQGQAFLEGDNILDVFTTEFFERDEVINLPEKYLSAELHTLQSEFIQMFEKLIYRRRTSRDDLGRKTRLQAWNTLQGSNRGTGSVLLTSTDDIIVTSEGVEIFLGDSDSLWFNTEEDMRHVVDTFNTVSVSKHTEKEIQVIEDLSRIETQPEIELSFYNSPSIRQYAEPESLDSSTVVGHVEALRDCQVGRDYTTTSILNTVFSEGYFTTAESLEVARFLVGHSDTLRMSYFYGVPEIIDELTRICDVETEYIPQLDLIIASRMSIPDWITTFRKNFPDKQMLTAEEYARISSYCGEPEWAVSPPFSTVETVAERQKIAELVESRVISDKELVDYHLTSWYPKTTTDSVLKKIQLGNSVREQFQASDYSFASTLIDRVSAGVLPNNSDFIPLTKLRPNSFSTSINSHSIDVFQR